MQAALQVTCSACNKPALPPCPPFPRATKKQGGSTKNKADSNPKYLGAKMSDGQIAFPGQIIVRQRGLRFKAGEGVGVVSTARSAAAARRRLVASFDSAQACYRLRQLRYAVLFCAVPW